MGILLLAGKRCIFWNFSLAVDDYRSRFGPEFRDEKLVVVKRYDGADFLLSSLVLEEELLGFAVDLDHAAIGKTLGAVEGEQYVAVW